MCAFKPGVDCSFRGNNVNKNSKQKYSICTVRMPDLQRCLCMLQTGKRPLVFSGGGWVHVSVRDSSWQMSDIVDFRESGLAAVKVKPFI